MQSAQDAPARPEPASVPGLIDSHAHLLRASSGVGFPATAATIGEFHRSLAASGSTPMDVPDPPSPVPPRQTAGRLLAGLLRAAAAGLTEVTEMGMREWWYLDALEGLQASAALPLRVRIYLASGLAEEAGAGRIAARRAATGPWVSLDGIKFYADGWLGPRTCAMCRNFDDEPQDGVLFAGPSALARRLVPFIAGGWRIATHAIGDRGIATVLDAYELAWDGDLGAMAAAGPRIEHASVQSAELVARMAAAGVAACIQPSFAVSDVPHVAAALGDGRQATAYPWATLAEAGVPMLAGTDFPIEVLDPLVGLARLVSGQSARAGFGSAEPAPPHSRLPAGLAFALLSDPAAGRTVLSADPREVQPAQIDQIDVLGTEPLPFQPG
ncbi:MAG TPA: amidohydrolase family protein [Streptosporangiaceae bacterium]